MNYSISLQSNMVDHCPPSKFASYYSEPNWLWSLVGFTNIYSLDVSFECCCSNITWKKYMGISTFTLLLATRSSTYIHFRRRTFKFIEVTLNWNTHTHTHKNPGIEAASVKHYWNWWLDLPQDYLQNKSKSYPLKHYEQENMLTLSFIPCKWLSYAASISFRQKITT